MPFLDLRKCSNITPETWNGAYSPIWKTNEKTTLLLVEILSTWTTSVHAQRKKNCVASDFATKCIRWHILQSVWKDHAACARARALSCTQSNPIPFNSKCNFSDNTMNYMFRYTQLTISWTNRSRLWAWNWKLVFIRYSNATNVVLHSTTTTATTTKNIHSVFNCIGVILVLKCDRSMWLLEVKHMHLIAKSITHSVDEYSHFIPTFMPLPSNLSMIFFFPHTENPVFLHQYQQWHTTHAFNSIKYEMLLFRMCLSERCSLFGSFILNIFYRLVGHSE